MDYYYAEPTSNRPTRKVPIVLDTPDDWWNWNSHIQRIAIRYGVLDILLRKTPRPTKPIHPDDVEPTNQTTAPNGPTAVARSEPISEEDNTQASRLPTEDLDPKTLYDRQERRWKRQLNEYKELEYGLTVVWQEIEQTVSTKLLDRLTDESDHAIEKYWKLKNGLEPSENDQKMDITSRYTRLQSKSANQNVETWLSEWEEVLGKCKRLDMTYLLGEYGTKTFLTALRSVDRMYAEIRLNELARDRSLDVFMEIHYFRKRWLSHSQRERKNAFATFKGKSPDEQNSDSTNQNQGNERPKRGPEDCPCGEKHRFDKCPYVIESIRPNGWKPNKDIEKKFEWIKENKPTLRQAMESAIKRANQNQNKESTRTVMSIIRSNSAVFSLGGSAYELRDSWIVDSGADIHICNDRTRFLTYEPVEDEYARFGATDVQILGYGKVELTAIGMNGKAHILELSRVAYLPECHTNLLSTFQMMKHGFYLNQRKHVIEDQDGIPICRTELRHNLEVVEYNPIPPNIFAMNRYSEKPHESAETSERWHQRLAHLGDEAVQHLEEASIGAKVLSCKRSICETCRLAKAFKQISRTPRERSTEPFGTVHFDLIQLPTAHNGDRWITHFVCEATGWHIIYTHPDKDQLNDLIKQFIEWVQTQFGVKPKRMFSDRERTLGKEYIRDMMQKGIDIFHSTRYIDEQKGFVERAGRTIIEMARSMRIAARLPEKLWPHIFHAAVYLHNRRPRREVVEENGKKKWIWITPYEKLYGKKPSLANLRVYGCRAYVRQHTIPKTKKLDPRAWVGYLVGYTASNIWKIWNPLTRRITDERDVTFDEDIVFDPAKPFHAEAIPISDLPEQPVEVNDLPIDEDIRIRQVEESSDDEELDEAESGGVNENEAINVLSEGGVPDEAGGQVIRKAELPKPNIEPPTPLVTPGRPIQHDEPIDSIEQDNDLERRAESNHGIPGGWIDSPQREQTYRLDLMTPRSPTRIDDSPEPETPIRLTDTLPESPFRLESDTARGDHISADSPSKQLFEEVNRLSIDPYIDPNDPDEPDDINDIPTKPKHSVSADFSEEHIIGGKRERRAPRGYGFTATRLDGLKRFHPVFATFGLGLQDETPKKRLHRDEIPPEPDGWKQMQKHPLKELFQAAAELEHNTLLARGTFEKVKTPRDKQIIPLRWVFKYKFDQEGYLIKAKARICVRGDLQKMTRDDTTAATLAARTFRTLMAIAAVFDLDIRQIDAVNAFVNSLLDEEVYTYMAEGFSEPGFVYRLRRALYGLRRAPRLWQRDITKVLEALGLRRIDADSCLYTNDEIVVLVFVDDILFLYRPESKKHADNLIRKLQERYEFRDLGEGDSFLNIKITRDRTKRKLWLSQRGYIEKIAARYHLDLTNRKPRTPGTEGLRPYDGKATIDEIHHYQSKIGSILYAAMITRLDIAKITSDLARYLLNPGPSHFDAANRVILYLASTKDYVLEYGGDLTGNIFIIASDAAYADQLDRSSSEGYLVKLFGAAVDWRAGKQRTVTTSTTEAELLALSEAAKNVYWWKRLFLDIGFDPEHEISILCDNRQTVGLLRNEEPTIRTKLRHVDIHQHWLRQEVQSGRIAVQWIETNRMPADGLTKLLPRNKHTDFCKMVGLVDQSEAKD
ncbi:hypothetical protein CNMCM5623_007239 [Aspergillus felis]|uniref:Integrase catalytic domain-containing protein n=1 Tax=Aspergillus felis TaxID=1287682 RepID=A0A8H6QMB8_9EURO|nr:hypothetical protein CNMCM5623_007239 [Aspergillus felis]